MEITFQVTRSDYIHYYRSAYLTALKKGIAFFLLIPLLIGIGISGNPLNPPTFILVFLVVLVMLGSFYFLLPFLRTIASINKLYGKKEEPILREYFLYTSETGMKLHKSRTEQIDRAEIKWAHIDSFNSDKKCISIKLADKSVFLIPKRFFSSPAEVLDFLGIMQTEMRRVSGRRSMTAGNTGNLLTPAKSARPSYFFGFFGLVPILGIISGIIFIFLGIRKFKDKWLVIIGALGIVTSIFMYFFIVSSAREVSRQFNGGFVSISQMELKELIKNIEFYKMQNGQYPDSLQQLIKGDNMVTIYDPILTNQKNPYFIYEKIGDKYTLFSAGKDGIPHTADDFYPLMDEYDSSKTGYIRPISRWP